MREGIAAVPNTLWRYIDLAQLASLLQTKTLHFCRGDKFEDQLEGSYPRLNLNDFAANGETYGAEGWRPLIVVSCWHASDWESDAMWRVYAPNGRGVAIATSPKSLSALVESHGGYVTDVKYLDFANERADIHIPSDVFEYKRRAFSHESEVRAIITSYPQTDIDHGMPRVSHPISGKEFSEAGYYLDIEPTTLIEKVVVSPIARLWFYEVVQQLAVKYDLPLERVVWSSLRDDPVYARMSRD